MSPSPSNRRSIDSYKRFNNNGAISSQRLPSIFDELPKRWMRLTDAPTSFIYAGTLFVMSAIYGPFLKLVLRHYAPARPKVWLDIFGASGITHKTTVIGLVRDTLRAVLPAECFLPCDFTQEGFLDMLRTEEGEAVFKDKPGIIFVDEFGGFMRAVKDKKYLAGLTNFINCLFDEAPFARRLRSGRINVPAGNYILMMVGLTTPISRYMGIDDFKSGFANRFLHVYGKSERFIPSFPTERGDRATERRGP